LVTGCVSIEAALLRRTNNIQVWICLGNHIGSCFLNPKPAREMGMTTIKVLNAAQAITELEAATRLKLR
jgi:hypothetical protein